MAIWIDKQIAAGKLDSALVSYKLRKFTVVDSVELMNSFPGYLGRQKATSHVILQVTSINASGVRLEVLLDAGSPSARYANLGDSRSVVKPSDLVTALTDGNQNGIPPLRER